MKFLRFIVAASSMACAFGHGSTCAQDYPTKPIRLMASEPGGITDFTARIIAQGISGPLGQSVIIDNRAANIVGELLAKSPPDGYALLDIGNNAWIAQLVQKTSYDPVKDFAPVTLLTATPQLVVVHPSVPVKSIKELIALAKARPGQLNYAAGGTGGASHLAAELLKSMSGINVVQISYKGTGPGLNALLAGEVQLMFGISSAVMAPIKAGRLKALAVTTAQPTALLPGVPTVAAAGVPGYEAVANAGVLAPGGTPAAIVNRLNQEIVRVFSRPDVKEKVFNVGAEVIVGTPDEFAAKIKSEIVKWSKVVKDAGIRVE